MFIVATGLKKVLSKLLPKQYKIHSFAPIEPAVARILILGSIPGKASLESGQYYFHPRNAFWPIMQQLLGFDINASYATRVAALVTANIALWDVLKSCERSGSMDQNIVGGSETGNDIQGFIDRHPELITLVTNGNKALSVLKKYFNIHKNNSSSKPSNFTMLRQQEGQKTLQVWAMPSTSPANARFSMAEKFQYWQKITWLNNPENPS